MGGGSWLFLGGRLAAGWAPRLEMVPEAAGGRRLKRPLGHRRTSAAVARELQGVGLDFKARERFDPGDQVGGEVDV